MRKLITYTFTKAIGLYINILGYVAPEKAKRLAYRFFSEPRDGRLIQGQLPKILQVAEAEMMTYKEFVFQVYTWPGEGKNILLVHGWESNASRWEQFIPYLQKLGYAITALDAPAHGLSSGQEFNIPRYAEFINIIVKQIQPAFMVGHSLGGATALYYQSHYHDENLEKMVILGAPSDLNILLANYSGMLSLNSKVMLLLKKHFIDHFKIKPDEFSGRLFASKITIPGLVVHDTKDEVVNFKEGKKIAGAWKNAELVVTRGLGHSLHDDALYNKICDFLQS